jgi:hypothetical protein
MVRGLEGSGEGEGGESKHLLDIENNCCFVAVNVMVVLIRVARRE